ncbi:MAG: cyclic nucleotide-binding domain-containing protein [Paraclostridium sp.]
MLKLHHESTLNFLIDKFNLDSLFNIELKQYLELHCFNKDELIYTSGENLEYLYLLVDGSAQSFNEANINYRNLYTLYSSFSVIGSLELFTDSKFSYNVKSLEECMCIAIHRDIINEFLLEDVKFLKFFCKDFSSKLSIDNINFNKIKRDAV